MRPVQPDKPVTSSIVKGSRVKVRDGAKTYDGKGVASFVYGNTYTCLLYTSCPLPGNDP